MKRNRGVFERYRRWRHSRGYGVHSPFAYRLVERVIHPGPYCYYGYGDIDETFPGSVDRRVRREARMLLRLVAELHPASIFLPTGIHPAYHAAVQAADSKIEIVRKPRLASTADMICTQADFIGLDTLRAHLAVPGHSVALVNAPEGWDEALFEAVGEGMMMTGTRNLFVVAREGMQKISYTVQI